MNKFLKDEFVKGKNIFNEEEINKLYEELNLPNDKDINKADYLEFYFCFGNNLEYYKSFYDIKKESNMSWKEFRNIRFKDVDLKKSIIDCR